MSITNEEFDRIVFKVTEKVLLRMPEVIGNLQMNLAETSKMTKEFYSKYPDFKNDPQTVQGVLGELDKANAGMKYEDILTKAVPMIRERMKTVKSLDTTSISEKSKLNLNIPMDGNGEL